MPKERITLEKGECIENDECGEAQEIVLPEYVKTTLTARLPDATVRLVIDGAQDLLSSSSLITKKPGTQREYLVYSKTRDLNTCKVNTYNVTCDCKGYKSKVTCKHSLAVAEKEHMLDRHMKWLSKQPCKASKTALLSQRDSGTGKKGGRPKCPRRKEPQLSTAHTVSANDGDYQPAFTKCYHNNEPFTIIHKRDVRRDRYKCFACNQPFEVVVPPSPGNLAIHHRGCWEYRQDKSDPNSVTVSKTYTDYYCHIRKSCIRGRYPYFLPTMLRICEGLALTQSQRDLLHKELNFQL